MSDIGDGAVTLDHSAATHDPQAAVQAGSLLRQAREAAGLHIAALAVSLKVPVGKLEALESGRIESLPDTVFVRALASSVCRTLKMDAAPILALLPQTQNPRLATDEAGINAPVKGSVPRAALPLPGRGMPRSVVLTVSLLLGGAVVLLFLPQLRSALEPLLAKPTLDSSVADPAVVAAPVTSDAAAPSLPVSGTASQPVVGGGVIAAPASGVSTGLVSTTAVVVEPGKSSAVMPAEPASVAVTASELLTLKARGQSWVQVKDASGVVLLQRNVAEGEVIPVSGKAPLSVVVGRAEVTEVFVRGQRFDLAPVTRENVARFEVK